MNKDDPDLFPLGRKIVSKNALAVLEEAGVDPNRLFERHWRLGRDRGQELVLDRMAVDGGYGSVASAYEVLGDVRVVALTQPDWGKTLMALPEEIERL